MADKRKSITSPTLRESMFSGRVSFNPAAKSPRRAPVVCKQCGSAGAGSLQEPATKALQYNLGPQRH
jgi:hypothetical protein